MNLVVERGPDWARVQLTGEIDLNWVEFEREVLSEFFADCPAFVVVDLQTVTFMDSTGLGFLARCVRSCHANHGDVVVTGANEMVRQMIDLTGLNQVLHVIKASAEQVLQERTPTASPVTGL